MDRFALLLHKWNVNLTFTPLDWERSEMLVLHDVVRLTVNSWMHPYERNETIGMQLGHLVLGHSLRSYTDVRGVWWRPWYDRQALDWAAFYLIPNQVLDQARKAFWQDWEIADACQVPVTLVHRRLARMADGCRAVVPSEVQCY